MNKNNIGPTSKENIIKVVRELLSKGENCGFLDQKHFPHLKVVISREVPSDYKILETITPPEDLKELLQNRNIYIVTELTEKKKKIISFPEER